MKLMTFCYSTKQRLMSFNKALLYKNIQKFK